MKIKNEVLRLILEAAKDSHPYEFGAFLREKYGVIYEIVLLPGTLSGRRSAVFNLMMKPIDFSIVGTVHSHPSGALWPSDEDLSMFSRTGKIHIIVGYPYTYASWKAYDRDGKEVRLEVV
jgi:proteasome lid subunit RPN8/RPN11